MDYFSGSRDLAMGSWKEFEDADPELAAFGAARLRNQVTYLATVDDVGWPRVHPVGPILGNGHLFVFMEPTSPKARDLRQNNRYAMHSSVRDRNGSNGEFAIRGRATLIEDPTLRALAAEISSTKPKDRYILFELSIETVMATIYQNDSPVRSHWSSGNSSSLNLENRPS